ncbi:RNA polymerase sigma-70 factor [Spirosoma endophyticum]|uniref:RNA polymerase sigma-70 factor, ECF subfamily n=1 Tax=Spirosoma endophyticum TaxID=662367 RepID=A0A1I2CDC8_9BACT|nr:RNA polymerase sigma-70 factor [Spirosoma endophyticum]SFE66296.1 RNA polymerase sigma-70 factor, ECF subfamily [Spirosoma endophyticum]
MQLRSLLDSADQPAQANLTRQRLPEPVEVVEENHAGNDTELFIRRTFAESPKKGCELLFRRYHQALCSHAVRFVYSKETAEDLVSDVFCKFWKTKAYETITSSYRYYLFRSVRNEAYNYLRLEFQQLDDIDTAAVREDAFSQRPDQILQFEEVFHQVEDLVESLPPQCRKVFLLNRFEGKKYQDIATELGISIKTVEVHIGKALGIVRKGLKDHWLMIMVAVWRLFPF